ncbi:MAG: hypothetical protein QGH70_12755 [Nitrospinota bacterium]|nr:hypothetical protein [Nitrospinota bacterium]
MSRTYRPSEDDLPALCLVKTVDGQAEALVLKARLEADRIPVHLNYESAGSVYGFRAAGLGQVRVLVPAAFAAAARQICGGEGEPPGPEDPEG